jgi:hypothetical protein
MPNHFSAPGLLFLLLLSFLPAAKGQSFRFEEGVPLHRGQERLAMPWTGGLNAVQASRADVTGDGREELVLFEHSSAQLYVFAQTTGGWQWLPEAQYRFPEGLRGWVLLADYNGNGRQDLFTATAAGVKVFEHIAAPGSPARWEERYPLLLYAGTNAPVNLLINSGDIPIIADTDGDGDLDIISFDPSGRGTIRWYKNVGMERWGRSDTLAFELTDRQWGGITECDCNQLALNYSLCPSEGERILRPLHAGGKSLLWKDLNGDGVPDLLIGDEECDLLYYLPNTGTAAAPLFSSVATGLPGAAQAPDFLFPAAFDLENSVLVSANLRRNSLNMDLSQSLWLYERQGPGAWALLQKDFLQHQMLDVGEEARPAFLDVDGDGDQDLLLGHAGTRQPDGYYASLLLYENRGTAAAPAFHLKESDYLGLAQRKWNFLHPQQVDFNADGSPDLILTGYDVSVNRVRTLLYLNQAQPGAPARFDAAQARELELPLSTLDYPHFFDVTSNGLPDVLVGRFDGSLRLFTTTGTAAAPQFALSEQAYKGFGIDNFRRPFIPTVGDVSGNGQADLVVTDGSGNMRVLYAFLQPGHTAANALPAGVQVGEGTEALRLGDKSWPVAVRLWQGEADALVVGQIGGGLLLLRNELGAEGQPEGGYTLEVYPNPSLGRPLTIKTNAPAQLMLYNSLGQVIKHWSVNGAEPLVWEPRLSPGMYIVVARFSGGRLHKKMIISP